MASAAPRLRPASACRNGAESHSHCGTATLRWWLADMQAEHNGSGLYRLSRAPHAGHDRGSAMTVQPPWCCCLDTKRECHALAMPKCHGPADGRIVLAGRNLGAEARHDPTAGAMVADCLNFTAGTGPLTLSDQQRCQLVMTRRGPLLTPGPRRRGRPGRD